MKWIILSTKLLEKFRKLEERLYSIEDKETEHEISDCERGDNFNKSQSNLDEHEKILDGRNSETVIETVENEEIYKCEVCDFTTTHIPGLKSHSTKMHGEKAKYLCEQCDETFDSRKKLKNHIYCVHRCKYQTLAQLIDEAVP